MHISIFIPSSVFPVITSTVLMDALSKLWIEHGALPPVATSLMGADLRLSLQHNSGLASGALSRDAMLPELLPIVSFLLVSMLLLFIMTSGLTSAAIPAGLIFGGGIGNLGDRVVHGHIDDFLYVGLGRSHAIVFNFADLFVAAGLVFLILIIAGQWYVALSAHNA